MEFKNKQAIYLQIADYVCDHILSGKWPAGEKMISIRELAIDLEVNPNTVLRTYEYLQQQSVIFNKRGIGYFVNETAPESIRDIRRQKFFGQELPEFVKTLRMLGIGFDEIKESLQNNLSSCGMETVYLMLGGNVGNREEYLRQCIDLLHRDAGTVTGMSAVYESEPWGFDDPDRFLNRVVALRTRHTPKTLLEIIQQIEQTLGRTRTHTGYEARTMDIDILLYGNLVIDTPDLVIPHPRMTERMFVLQPMAELAPDLEHPVLHRTMTCLRDQCKDRKTCEVVVSG